MRYSLEPRLLIGSTMLPDDNRFSRVLSRFPTVAVRKSVLPIVLVLLASFSAIAKEPRGDAKAEKLARSVTIYRDNYGVPHIYGPTDASCVFGYAYAQAEDNFKQIEDSYIHAIGRAAEVGGDKELPSDLLNRALEIPSLSQQEYEHATGRS